MTHRDRVERETQPLGQFGFPCPECQRLISAKLEQAGNAVECPACRAKVEVPTAAPIPRKDRAGLTADTVPRARSEEVRPKLVPMKVPRVRDSAEGDWGGSTEAPEVSRFYDRLLIPAALRRPARMLILTLAFGLVVAGIIAFFRIEGASEANLVVAPAFPPEDLLGPDQIAKQFVDPDASIEDRLALLREPFDPSEVREQFAVHGPEWESGVDSIDLLRQGQMLDVGYHFYRVIFGNGDERHLYLTEEPDGFRIDWNAYRHTGIGALDELLTGKVPAADMLVMICPSAYYDHAFPDKEAFSAFVLTSSDPKKNDVFAYARKRSTTARILLQVVTEAQKPDGILPVAMKLRLESLDGSHQHRQFLISHVVASTWVESRLGTLEDLWLVSRRDEGISIDQMKERAGEFEGYTAEEREKLDADYWTARRLAASAETLDEGRERMKALAPLEGIKAGHYAAHHWVAEDLYETLQRNRRQESADDWIRTTLSLPQGSPLDQLEKIAAHLERSVELAPINAEATRLLRDIHLRLARERLSRLELPGPGVTLTHLTELVFAGRQAFNGVAVPFQVIGNHLRRAAELAPEHREAQVYLAYHERLTGDHDRAIDRLAAALPQTPELGIPLAVLVLEKGHPQRAKECLTVAVPHATKALQADPSDSLVRLLLIHARIMLAEVPRALELIAEGERLQPDQPAYRIARATAHFSRIGTSVDQATPDFDQAFLDLEAAVKLEPDFLFLLEFVKLLGNSSQARQQARLLLTRLLNAGLHSDRTQRHLGDLALMDGDFPSAIRFYEGALEQLAKRTAERGTDGDSSTKQTEKLFRFAVLNNLAWSLTQVEPPELQRALLMVDEVIAGHREMSREIPFEFYDSRGQILAKLERWEEAAADLEQALAGLRDSTEDISLIESEPDLQASIHQTLALCYRKLGRDSKADLHTQWRAPAKKAEESKED